jgi:hypothetical protein
VATRVVVRKCFGLPRGYVESIAGEQELQSLYMDIDFSGRSELTEPQKLLTYLLQPSIASLSPDIIAVYVHAATKVFGYWAAEIAQRWDDDRLPEIKSVVEMVIERVSDFNSSPHIEVQERASNLSMNCIRFH